MPKRQRSERAAAGRGKAKAGAERSGAKAGRTKGDKAAAGKAKPGRTQLGKAGLATVNISMPATLRDRVAERVREGSFGNVSEYFRHLVREDLRTLEALEKLLLEGLASGPPEEMTAAWIERRRAAARAAGEAAQRGGMRKAG